MHPDDCRNLVEMFFALAAESPERPFLHVRREGVWQAIPRGRVAADVARLAAGLRALGIGRGDRVVLVSENRPEWLIADFAIMAAGAITVPAYTTNTMRDHLHILENSRAVAAIVSTAGLARALLPAVHQVDSLTTVIAMERPRISQSIDAEIHLWEELLAAQPDDTAPWRAAAQEIGREDIACLIYTSGTGGAPKGVMIPHGAILSNCAGGMDVLDELGLDDNCFLSFLPLSHAYEHTAGQALPISIGAEICYAEGLDRLAQNMAETRPTIMVVVPRLFELLRNRVLRQVEKDGGLARKLFERALDLGIRRHRDPAALGLADRLADRLLDRLVRARVRQRFGGRIKALVSGGAPLNPEVGEFFIGLGLPLLQGYGQTESGPIVSVNRPSRPKVRTVGPPMWGVEVRIADDGEILVRGELVMKGYWGDDRATAAAIRDGWLHTGDIGHIDADGHLEITDRKKDIIVSNKGETVSPQRIEGMLTLEPEIAQAMVHGDRRPYLVGLVVPDTDWLASWAAGQGKPAELAGLAGDAGLHAALDVAVARVNARLAAPERVRRFRIPGTPFSIDNEHLTPTLKIRRHIIARTYAAEIEAMYKGTGKR